MRAERLFRAIGLVDEELIEAASAAPAKKRPVWRRYGAMAACLCVICLGGFAWLVTGGFHGYGSSGGSAGAGGTGIDKGESTSASCVNASRTFTVPDQRQ